MTIFQLIMKVTYIRDPWPRQKLPNSVWMACVLSHQPISLFLTFQSSNHTLPTHRANLQKLSINCLPVALCIPSIDPFPLEFGSVELANQSGNDHLHVVLRQILLKFYWVWAQNQKLTCNTRSSWGRQIDPNLLINSAVYPSAFTLLRRCRLVHHYAVSVLTQLRGPAILLANR